MGFSIPYRRLRRRWLKPTKMDASPRNEIIYAAPIPQNWSDHRYWHRYRPIPQGPAPELPYTLLLKAVWYCTLLPVNLHTVAWHLEAGKSTAQPQLSTAARESIALPAIVLKDRHPSGWRRAIFWGRFLVHPITTPKFRRPVCMYVCICTIHILRPYHTASEALFTCART